MLAFGLAMKRRDNIHARRGLANMQIGFTLIEVMITIAVLSIMLMYLPNYKDMIAKYRTVSTANSLAGTLKRARVEAMKLRQTVVVCPSADGVLCIGNGNWSNGWIAFPDANNNQQHDNNPNEQIFISNWLRQSFTITSNFANNNGKIVFLPSGLASGFGAGGGSISVCESSNRYTGSDITINSIGRPRIDARACP